MFKSENKFETDRYKEGMELDYASRYIKYQSVNKWKSSNTAIIKYNAQSSPYNEAMQNSYINGRYMNSSQSSNTSNIESTINVTKNADGVVEHMNPYLITFNSENNMTDN